MSLHYLECAARTQIHPASKKLVLMCLADSAGNDTGIALPGREALMAWSQVGASTLKKYLAELEDEGWIRRTQTAHRGRRAEYAVFSEQACCEMHGAQHPQAKPHTSYPQAENSPTESYPQDEWKGADVSAPFEERGLPRIGPIQEKGADNGADNGADPGAAPFVTSKLPYLSGGGNYSARAEQNPLPQDQDFDPKKCPQHQGREFPPPCRACAQAREATERRLEQQRRREAEQARRERQARLEAAEAAIAACGLCDHHGQHKGRTCQHNEALEAERDRQIAEQAEINRRGAEQLRRARQARRTA